MICEPDRLIDLSAGLLPEVEAHALREHVATCVSCQEQLAAADEIIVAISELEPFDASDQARERSWSTLAEEAASTAARMERRRAVSVLAKSWRWAALVIIALGVAFLVYRQLNKAEQQITHATPTPVVTTTPLPTQQPATPVPEVVVDPRTLLACGALADFDNATVRILKDDKTGAVLQLDDGVLPVEVPELTSDQEVVVVTEEARVVVHGTQFTVLRSNAGTHVGVTEGVVTVEMLRRSDPVTTLRAGGEMFVDTLAVYLNGLLLELDEAVDVQDFGAAQQVATEYLQTAGTDFDAPDVQLRLAGVLRQQGQTEDAISLYRRVADGSASQLVRENALATLARLHSELGHHEAARGTWQELLRRYPDGQHALEASEILKRE